MNLFNSINNTTTGENGAVAFLTSGLPIIDLFYNLSVIEDGQTMKQKVDMIMDDFTKSFVTDKISTLALVFWARDPKNGLGNKLYFREIFMAILTIKPKASFEVLNYGLQEGWFSWKDFFVFFEHALELSMPIKREFAQTCFQQLLVKRDNLFLKWFPRKGLVFSYISKASFFHSPKELRKILTKYETVETLVSAHRFSEVRYEHVPSKSNKLHAKTFQKFDAIRYTKHLEDVKSGKSKMNVDTLYPHEILEGHNTWDVKETMWSQLKDLVPDGQTFLPVCDCSGSMEGKPLSICHALGIYLAEKNKSEIFGGHILTFSHNPYLIKLEGTLEERVNMMERFSEVANTNFEKIFNLILHAAVTHQLKQEDLPKNLICLTDGQFDKMSDYGSDTHVSKYRKVFAEHGYTLPNIIFWNLRATKQMPERNVPGVVFLSGATPRVMNNALSGLTTQQIIDKGIQPYRVAALHWVEKEG